MNEYRYTAEDRQAQLQSLASALRNLIELLPSIPEFSSRVEEYEAALQNCEALLRNGFVQDQLSELGRSVPDLFFRHKEWTPPLEQVQTGEWREPRWFVLLEEKLKPLLVAANILHVVGYY